MKPLTLDDLVDLDTYEALRDDYRRAVIEHKAARRVAVGDRVTLVFEDRETLRFQVLEMARVERIRDPRGLAHELAVYGELLPGDDELSASLFIEITDKDRIRPELDRLVGLDEHVSLELGDAADRVRIHAAFDPKQLEEDRISAVQYIRFRLPPGARALLADPALPARICIDHPAYQSAARLGPETRRSLLRDLSDDTPNLLSPDRVASARRARLGEVLLDTASLRAVARGGAETLLVVVESKTDARSILDADPEHLRELLAAVRDLAGRLVERHGACHVSTLAARGPGAPDRLRFELRARR